MSPPNPPTVSVVVRTRNEAPRLRLTLASLAMQAPFEVIVTDDGSSDETSQVLREAADGLPLRTVRHATAQGRSAASNASAMQATGEVLLFLDGDTLAGPGCVQAHARAHAQRLDLIGRGDPWHLRATRFLHDPELGIPRAGEEARWARLSPAERQAMKVTKAQVLHDFGAVARRAQPGIYPGAGPRRLHGIELQALRDEPSCPVLWAAACGSNLSVRRSAFLAVGGFDPEIDIAEQRELAARLCAHGLRMGLVAAARTYHLTHRSGWRDPLQDNGWEKAFLRSQPGPAARLLPVLWASLADHGALPAWGRIESLPALAHAAATLDDAAIEQLRRLTSSAGAAHG